MMAVVSLMTPEKSSDDEIHGQSQQANMANDAVVTILMKSRMLTRLARAGHIAWIRTW